MTRSPVTLLDMSMSAPVITITLLEDHDRYHVTALVEGTEYELGVYDTTLAAAERMNAFVTGHGYTWAPGSALRVDEAQRANACCLVLDAVPGYKALRRCQCPECIDTDM